MHSFRFRIELAVPCSEPELNARTRALHRSLQEGAVLSTPFWAELNECTPLERSGSIEENGILLEAWDHIPAAT
jgi:hypothetical protein